MIHIQLRLKRHHKQDLSWSEVRIEYTIEKTRKIPSYHVNTVQKRCDNCEQIRAEIVEKPARDTTMT